MKKKIIIEVETEESNERIKSHTERWIKDNFKGCKTSKVEIYESES